MIHKNYSYANLQGESFANEDLSYASFVGSDLRGADLSGANCTGADFTKVKTGITPLNMLWIFFAAVVVSLVSGYVAMLTGRNIQRMLTSNDEHVRAAGLLAVEISVIFILYAWWKGGGNAIRNLIIPASVASIVIGLLYYTAGWGTGAGMLYMVFTFALLVMMFIIGTIARAAAGTLSNILFLIVAVSGSLLGRSVGGGVAAAVMAIACSQISKRALQGAEGFEFLRRVAITITRQFGTSFRNTTLISANFSQSSIHNTDFTDANISSTTWDDSKRINCIAGDKIIPHKK